MPILDINAPTFATTLTAPYTLAQCDAFLRQAFANAGFPAPAATRAGTVGGLSNVAVYDMDLKPTATYGRFKFVFESSQASVGAVITLRATLFYHANYNNATFVATANTGANNTTGATFTVAPTNPLTAYSIPTTQEIFGISLLEASVLDGFLGMAYFTNKEDWYDENSWCWAMLVQPTLLNSFWSPYPNPQASAATTAIPSRAMIDTFGSRNPANNKAYAVTAPYVTTHAWGIAGQFPVDISITNTVGFLPGDILVSNPGIEEYWLAQPLNCGVAFRCV